MAHPGVGPARRVVVFGPSWLGDAVMAQSLYKALARTPGTTVDVVTPPLFEPLLKVMPEVRRCIPSPFRAGRLGLAARFRLGRELSRCGYDQAIVLPNSWKSALTPWLAGVPRRTGYLGEQRWGLINDVRRLDETALPMTAQRFAALAFGAGEPFPDIEGLYPSLAFEPGAPRRTAASCGLDPGAGPGLVLCPGAHYGTSKQWPARHFARVAADRLGRGWQVWIVGTGDDTPIARQIDEHCDNRCVDLTGRTSVQQAAHLIALSTAVVSNDSGLMHVAAALGKPLVAVFGSTDPDHTPPLSETCSVEYLGLHCSPCFKRECPLGHHDCMNGIAPERVLEDLDRLIG